MKASHALAADFRQLIARGELKAGDPLPVESELVERLGAAKSVVREALRILEHEGLVEVRRGLGGGPRVRHPSISEAAHGMGIYLQIGDVPVVDVWTARDRIVAAAVERLAADRSEPAGAALAEAVSELSGRIGDFDAYYPQLIEVAETVVRLAGNATELILVVALRHIIAAELDAATRAVVDFGEAVDAERNITDAWGRVVRHIRAGRPGAARRAFESQAVLIRDGIALRAQGTRVSETFGQRRAPSDLLRLAVPPV
jgi:GntR family transcriptional repressor for pyruvate dehydrogenase complex